MYLIEQCSDVFVDACIRNDAGVLMLMSIYGRETATKELLARMQLAHGEQGISELTLRRWDNPTDTHVVSVGDPNRLDKYGGRVPCIYGQLTHLWVYDPLLQGPDKGARQAWLIEPREQGFQERLRARAWHAVCDLASVPLLPHWREPVLKAIWDSMVTVFGESGTGDYNPRFSRPIGHLAALRVKLTDAFPDVVSQLIKEGDLELLAPGAVPPPPPPPLLVPTLAH